MIWNSRPVFEWECSVKWGKSSSVECFFAFEVRAAASTSTACGPEFPCLSTPVVDFLSASEVCANIARSSSAIALSPVGAVDLPETDIFRAVGVVELGVGISTALVRSDALAAWLAPAWISGASSSNVNLSRGCAALAVIAFSWGAVATASVGYNEGQAEGEEQGDFGYWWHLY